VKTRFRTRVRRITAHKLGLEDDPFDFVGQQKAHLEIKVFSYEIVCVCAHTHTRVCARVCV
jgi:hypothetical protein